MLAASRERVMAASASVERSFGPFAMAIPSDDWYWLAVSIIRGAWIDSQRDRSDFIDACLAVVGKPPKDVPWWLASSARAENRSRGPADDPTLGGKAST